MLPKLLPTYTFAWLFTEYVLPTVYVSGNFVFYTGKIYFQALLKGEDVCIKNVENFERIILDITA